MSNNELLTIKETLDLSPFDYAWVQIGEIGDFEIMQVQLTKIKTLCFKAFDGSVFNFGDKSIFKIEKIEKKLNTEDSRKGFFEDKKNLEGTTNKKEQKVLVTVEENGAKTKNFFKRCDSCGTRLRKEVFIKNKGLCSECISEIN